MVEEFVELVPFGMLTLLVSAERTGFSRKPPSNEFLSLRVFGIASTARIALNSRQVLVPTKNVLRNYQTFLEITAILSRLCTSAV